MASGIKGWHRDRWIAPDGSILRETALLQNRVVHRGLDLLGDLLAGTPGRSGLRWFALGAGDPSWDANLPAPPETAISLTRELFRVPLTAANFAIDPVQRSITLKLTIPHILISETLREFGVLGGDATALPGTGFLFSYRIHPAIAPSSADLDRQLTLQFQVPKLADSGWLTMAELLTGQPAAAPIAWWAEGSGDPAWDAAPPAPDPKITALKNEIFRAPLNSRRRLWYEAGSHTVVASLDLDFSEANAKLRETALFNGADQPRLVAYSPYPAVDHISPQTLHREFRLELSGDLTAKVPALAGLTLQAAQTALAAAGLAGDPITPREDAAHAGQIVDFAPAAGILVPVASRVALIIGVLPRATVPNVVGLQPADGSTVLTARGLKPGDGGQDIVPEGGIPGSILRQQPAPGVVVDQGSTVLLTVGLPRMVAVPDLTGLDVQQAAVALDLAHLALALAPFPTQESDAESGSIVLQTPAAGTQAVRSSAVQVTLATYRTLEVPDLTGKTPTDAQALVQAASDGAAKTLGRQAPIPWLAIGDTQGQDSDAAAGTIVSQIPAPHARVAFYTAIHIVIAQPPLVVVPDVIGQINMDAVGVLLTKARLKQGASTSQPSRLPAGSIISQTPLAGVSVAAGSTVDMTIATPILVTVPSILNLSIGAAGELINGRGLAFGTPVLGAGTQPDGTVIAQTPAAGSSVATGTTVIPTIIRHIPVPNVVGQSRSAATSALQTAGFATITVTLQRSEQAVGNVLTQVPTAGASAFATTAIALTVAQGQVLPNLVGTPATNIANTIGSLNLRFDTVNQPSNQAVGTVLSQDPVAGTEVPLGTLVHFTVAAGVAVPNVVGMTPDAAKAALTAARLQIAVNGQGTIVAAQTPTPSQIVPLAAVVTVTLRMTTVAAPDVRGKLSEVAIAALQSVGLAGTVATRVVNTAPVSTIVAQDVAPGTIVNLGTTLKLTVSSGLVVGPAPRPIG